MVCYLVRHGQDDETIRGGWSDHPLTDTGIRQAEELAQKLTSITENAKIHCIYSSDLRRAMQTSQILAEKLCLPVVPLAQFREVNNGDLAGMQNDTALIQYPGLFWNQLRWDQPYPNGESPRQFYERIQAAWVAFSEQLLLENKNGILVTHGGVISVIRAILENRAYSNTEMNRKTDYGEIIVLMYQDGSWKETVVK